MKIYQPLKNRIINQRFGENKACVSTDDKRHFITCNGKNPPEGYKSVYGTKGHLGIDFGASSGQEVYAVREGTVYFIDTHERSGLDVRIEHMIDGKKYRSKYEHLKGWAVKVGDKVKTGQIVGWADNTGWSSGNHLHFQFEQMINGEYVPIDPLPFMEPLCAREILKIENKIIFIRQALAEIADKLAKLLRK